MPVIRNIATAVPSFAATQAEVKAVFGPLFPLSGRRLGAAMALQEISAPRTLTQTMEVYATHARRLGEAVARDCLRGADVGADALDMMITVSCTGVMIPSLDAYLMDALGTRRDLRRLPLTELGCVGGAAAVARAFDYLRGHPRAHVLVVAVELPSLSLQRLDVSPDNLVASALFGDGAAAVLVTGDDVAPSPSSAAAAGVRIRETLCHTRPESTRALGFDLHEDGFHAVLAKDVPALLRADLGGLVAALAAAAGVDARALEAFVVHPGGKRILGAVEEALGLRREQTLPSWEVLRDHGNQSSASVLFVLERWMRGHARPAAGTTGIMAAFGPGLTTELLLLEWT